jgi:hypothetical protein
VAGVLRFVAFMSGHATCYELAMFLVEPRSALGSDLERSAALSRRVPVEVVYGLRLGYQCLLTASAICAANAVANKCIHAKAGMTAHSSSTVYCPA